MVLVAIEVEPVRSKSSAAVDVRISRGERHEFDAAAPLPTRALSLEQGRAGGSVESSPKLVRRRDRSGSQNNFPHTSLKL